MQIPVQRGQQFSVDSSQRIEVIDRSILRVIEPDSDPRAAERGLRLMALTEAGELYSARNTQSIEQIIKIHFLRIQFSQIIRIHDDMSHQAQIIKERICGDPLREILPRLI